MISPEKGALGGPTMHTLKLNLSRPLRRALTVLSLLLVVPNLPNASLARGQDARDYHLLQEAANQQNGYSLADPSDASSLQLADLFDPFGGSAAPSDLMTRQSGAHPAGHRQQHADRTPGHYEFEVAPKMEPPGAPKPPFKQASTSCPGSDLFAGFSPKHTLCGDLYQGRVPRNPMGQLVNEQAYPFELIKNKTLQFLARSLPILKTEYETIPKVARYLPAHHLLNPTHQQSPLGHQHLHKLNQMINGRERTLPAPSQLFLQERRRRRRSTNGSGVVSVVVPAGAHQQVASITVAELMPNASLVVSSAHSSTAGRIGLSHPNYSSLMQLQQHHRHSARSADAHQQAFTMITKEGQRPISAPTTRSGGDRHHHQQQAQSISSKDDELHDSPTHKGQQTLGGGVSGKSSFSQPTRSHVSPAGGQQIGSAGQGGDSGGGGDTAAPPSPQAGAPARSADDKQLQTRSAAPTEGRQLAQDPGSPSTTSDGSGGQSSLAHRSGAQAPASSSSAISHGHLQRPIAASGRQQATSYQAAPQPQQPQQQDLQHLKCSNVNGLLMYTVCQAAAALIEGDSAPSWLQAAKQIGSLYAATASVDSYSPAAANANPFWSLWSALAPAPDSRSSSELAYKSTNGSHHQRGALSSPIASVASVINLLNPLMSLFAPSLQRTGDLPAGSVGKASADSQRRVNSSQHPAQAKSGGLAASLRTLSSVLLTGLSLAGLYDWLGASSLSSPLLAPMATTFARRKKPYDPSETFVDTPASLAAMASAKKLAPGILSAQQQPQQQGQASAGKQPPTPCASVEEYISPTFARNYQGAWKYVVQIPHEGYFTQTIQRSSCVRHKCEFTDGVCHEAPRWVSLLVAEIYYPNAIFGSSPPGGPQQSGAVLDQRVAFDGLQQQQLNQLMAAAPSTSQIQQVAFANAMAPASQHQPRSTSNAIQHQQDPLQMTDSLHNYNHNLNSAFFNAALELGLNPMNVAQMEQLASLHDQQLMQRNGLAPASQQQPHQMHQPQAESRIGMSNHQQQQHQLRLANNHLASGAKQQATSNNQQQQFNLQPVAQLPQLDQNQVLSNDYIRALAFEAIRQNPNLSIDELIRSIEMQPSGAARRRKRDLTATTASSNNNMPQQQPQQSVSALQYNQKFQAESLPSLNELVAGATQVAQQQVYEFGLSSTPSPMAPQQQPQQTQFRFQAQQHQQVANQINANNQQQQIRSGQVDPQQQQMLASQSTLAHDVVAANQQARVTSNQPQAQQQSSDSGPASQPTSGAGNQANASPADANQVECDGHDKIGCYVVRVYYDWFLVNGSCKCWKASLGQQQAGQTGGAPSSSASSASGSFIRRIFTG